MAVKNSRQGQKRLYLANTSKRETRKKRKFGEEMPNALSKKHASTSYFLFGQSSPYKKQEMSQVLFSIVTGIKGGMEIGVGTINSSVRAISFLSEKRLLVAKLCQVYSLKDIFPSILFYNRQGAS